MNKNKKAQQLKDLANVVKKIKNDDEHISHIKLIEEIFECEIDLEKEKGDFNE